MGIILISILTQTLPASEASIWAQIVATVGFPIAITAYLIIRVDKTLGELRDTIRDVQSELNSRRQDRETPPIQISRSS